MFRFARTRLLAVPVAVAAVIGAPAPGGDDSDLAAFDGPSAAPTSDIITDSTGELDVISPDVPDPERVVAEGTFVIPGTDEEVRVGVESIVVTEQTMELRLIVTPLDGPASVYDAMNNGLGVIPTTLIDRTNLKEYTVLRDGSTRYETDPILAEAEQASVRYQRFFAAPEDDIEVIDVNLHPAWSVLEDVPLTFEAD